MCRGCTGIRLAGEVVVSLVSDPIPTAHFLVLARTPTKHYSTWAAAGHKHGPACWQRRMLTEGTQPCPHPWEEPGHQLPAHVMATAMPDPI